MMTLLEHPPRHQSQCRRRVQTERRSTPGWHRTNMEALQTHLTNRRMRGRMSGGVGGARETRAPT